MAFNLKDIVSPEEAVMILEIQADPTNNDLRLIYADWLEEHGDPKCEYVRLDWELASGHGTGREQQILARLEELRPTLDREWLSLTARSAIEQCQRGSYVPDEPVCPARWLALKAGDQASVRACHSCGQPVFFCRSLAEAKWHAKQGDTVAVDATVERTLNDLRSRQHGTYGPPAVVDHHEDLSDR